MRPASKPLLHSRGSGAALVRAGKALVELIIIVVAVRTFLVQPFNIPSGSLEPTVLVGDDVLVSKFAYGYSRFSFPFGLNLFSGRIWASRPKRGDIAVFKLPRDESTDYIKRVIGLPGDKIQLIDARLYINGEPVPRERTQSIITANEYGQEVPVPTYVERLPGGVAHLIVQRDGDTGFFSNTPVYTVPPGQYFMMGDNRDNSLDSRVAAEHGGVGYVPLENFVGRAEVVFFSRRATIGGQGEVPQPAWQFWRWPWSVRWDRIFMRLR